jgi:hypothetical protein
MNVLIALIYSPTGYPTPSRQNITRNGIEKNRGDLGPGFSAVYCTVNVLFLTAVYSTYLCGVSVV